MYCFLKILYWQQGLYIYSGCGSLQPLHLNNKKMPQKCQILLNIHFSSSVLRLETESYETSTFLYKFLKEAQGFGSKLTSSNRKKQYLVTSFFGGKHSFLPLGGVNMIVDGGRGRSLQSTLVIIILSSPGNLPLYTRYFILSSTNSLDKLSTNGFLLIFTSMSRSLPYLEVFEQAKGR